MNYTNFTGSDCTGTDKTANRTLLVPGGFGFVVVERKVLHPETDYIVSSNTITFTNLRIDNRWKITTFI